MFADFECIAVNHHKILTFKVNEVAVISLPLSNKYANLGIFELCPQLQRIMREWGEKDTKTGMDKFIKVIAIYCVSKQEKIFIKSVKFILFHDFIKQAQGYSLLHLEANKNFCCQSLCFSRKMKKSDFSSATLYCWAT